MTTPDPAKTARLDTSLPSEAPRGPAPVPAAGKAHPKIRNLVLGLATLGLLGGAIWAIHMELEAVPVEVIFRDFRQLAPLQIWLAIAGTAVGYGANAGYDSLALIYLGRTLPFRKTLFASFSAYAISNSLGVPLLTGGTVRYRLYTSWGLSSADVAVIAVLTGVALYLGAITISGIGLVFEAGTFHDVFGLSSAASLGLGLVCLGLSLTPVLVSLFGPPVWSFRSLSIRRPSLFVASSQTAVGVGDWVASAFVLYILMPPDMPFNFVAFVPLFAAAALAGAISGLPGGIGVFEAVVLLLFPKGEEAQVAAGLIAFRAIYYLLPLVTASMLLGGHQLVSGRRHLAFAERQIESFASGIAPTMFSLLSFVTGLLMLASAVTPSAMQSLHHIARFVPLPVIELSHFTASLIGTLLLFVAMGLRRRLNGAWLAAVILLSLGTVLTFLKGGHIAEIVFLLLMIAILISGRPGFYRKAALLSMQLTWPWALAILCGVGAVLWLGLLSYRHVEYANELWWQFSLHGDAARYLRSGAGIAAMVILFFAWQLASPFSPQKKYKAGPEELAQVQRILAGDKAGHADANLALTGDKRFLFSRSGESFLMYGIRGRSWIAMGGPVGKPSERLELAWSFRELADTYDAWPVFYAIRGDLLAAMAEIGLTVQKIGEAAMVDAAAFSLEGSSRAKLRNGRRRLAREGWQFEVIAPEDVAQVLPALKAVSDEWLASHQGVEKGFTLGAFDPAYLTRCPMAVMRKGAQIGAFANLWTTPHKSELSIDLMRYSRNAPKGVMDILITELILWAGAEGYKLLDLGMAPLAGLEARRAAPMMTRLGAFVFEYGEGLYGFGGLRDYKNKFDPVWEPLYLAAPGQLVVPVALGDVALLTSGGIIGALRRG